ncbi:MAG: hypothetical protein AAFQ94_26540 [Bacteroidota bacterium]
MSENKKADEQDYQKVFSHWMRKYDGILICNAIRYVFTDLPEKLTYFEDGELIKSSAELIENSNNRFYLKASSLISIISEEILPLSNQQSDLFLQSRIEVIRTNLNDYNSHKKVTKKTAFSEYNKKEWKAFEDKFGASTRLFKKEHNAESKKDTIKLLIAVLGLIPQKFEKLLADLKDAETIETQIEKPHADKQIGTNAQAFEYTDDDEDIEVDIDGAAKQSIKSVLKEHWKLVLTITASIVVVTFVLEKLVPPDEPAPEVNRVVPSEDLFGKSEKLIGSGESDSIWLEVSSIYANEFIGDDELLPVNNAYVSIILVNKTNSRFFPDEIFFKCKAQNLVTGDIAIQKVAINADPNLLVNIPDKVEYVSYQIKNKPGFYLEVDSQISSLINISGADINPPKTVFISIGMNLRKVDDNEVVTIESGAELEIAFTED